ncbi:MAG: hypothetical protein ACRCV0_04530 [Brevinema sp.]
MKKMVVVLGLFLLTVACGAQDNFEGRNKQFKSESKYDPDLDESAVSQNKHSVSQIKLDEALADAKSQLNISWLNESKTYIANSVRNECGLYIRRKERLFLNPNDENSFLIISALSYDGSLIPKVKYVDSTEIRVRYVGSTNLIGKKFNNKIICKSTFVYKLLPITHEYVVKDEKRQTYTVPSGFKLYKKDIVSDNYHYWGSTLFSGSEQWEELEPPIPSNEEYLLIKKESSVITHIGIVQTVNDASFKVYSDIDPLIFTKE